jgi:SAM-dependent methyltransferase
MQIDRERIQTILEAEHSFYGARIVRKDSRWCPSSWDLIASQLSPAMDVLDVGCGNGSALLEISPRCHSGLGIDNDPEHIRLADEKKRSSGIHNVEFRLLDFPSETARLQPESFDMVYSLRGPASDTDENIQAALHLLRPGGLIFCEEIGELHDHEAREIFQESLPKNSTASRAGELRAALERNGVNIRLTADVFDKWIYPDVYAWLQYQCNLWTWLGIPLPGPDDPRIDQFAERNTVASGEIETTHHVAWAAGVKA